MHTKTWRHDSPQRFHTIPLTTVGGHMSRRPAGQDSEEEGCKLVNMNINNVKFNIF